MAISRLIWTHARTHARNENGGERSCISARVHAPTYASKQASKHGTDDGQGTVSSSVLLVSLSCAMHYSARRASTN